MVGMKESGRVQGMGESRDSLTRQSRESVERLKESSVIQSFKGSKLRRCVSLEFQKKEEKKMKLRDYLYLN
jgi:hypothetical protein